MKLLSLISFIIIPIYTINIGINITPLIVILCFILGIKQDNSKNFTPPIIIVYIVCVFLSEFFNKGIFRLGFINGFTTLISAIIISRVILQNPKAIKIYTNGLLKGIILSLIYYLLNMKIDAGETTNRYTTDFMSASTIGCLSIFLFIYALVQIKFNKSNKRHIYLLIFSLFPILFSLSKNAFISLFIIILCNMIFFNFKLKIKYIIILVPLFILVFLYFQSSIEYINDFVINQIYEAQTHDESEYYSISGRGPIWQVCYDEFLKKPLLGNGYYSAIDILEKKTYNNATQGHGLIFHSLISVGIMGTLSLLYFLIQIIFLAYRKNKILKNNYTYIWLINLLIYLIIRSITESSIAQGRNIDMYLFLPYLIYLYYMLTMNRTNK